MRVVYPWVVISRTALRDPVNANLDRVQLIKGRFDGKETQERIYDVACSDGCAIVDRRCEREVGSTVDVDDASHTNTIGDPLLTARYSLDCLRREVLRRQHTRRGADDGAGPRLLTLRGGHRIPSGPRPTMSESFRFRTQSGALWPVEVTYSKAGRSAMTIA